MQKQKAIELVKGKIDRIISHMLTKKTSKENILKQEILQTGNSFDSYSTNSNSRHNILSTSGFSEPTSNLFPENTPGVDFNTHLKRKPSISTTDSKPSSITRSNSINRKNVENVGAGIPYSKTQRRKKSFEGSLLKFIYCFKYS